MKENQQKINEILSTITKGKLSIFGINPVRRNVVNFYHIVRCNFAQNLKRDLKSDYCDRIKSWFDLDISSYSANTSIDNTTIKCSNNLHNLKPRMDYLENTNNQHSWDSSKFKKTKYFMFEFSFNSKKLLIISKCPGGWNLKNKKVLNLLDNGNFIKSKSEVLLFNEYPEILTFDDSAYTRHKSNFENFFKIEDGLRHQLDEFREESIITNNMKNLDLFQEKVKGNKRYLNLLSDAYIKGLYRSASFWEKVKEANTTHRWGLVYTDNKIEVNTNNLENILYILKDGKVKSLITGNDYNMDRSSD